MSDLTTVRQGDLVQLVIAGAADRTDFRYVWNLWDGEIRTTVEPAIDKTMNRVGELPVTVTVVGPRGQSTQLQFMVSGYMGPTFTGLVEPDSNEPVPRVISLAAEATDPFVPITGVWTDQDNKVLGHGPYLRETVNTADTQLTYTATDEIGTVVTQPFNVVSQPGTRPVVGEISVSVSAPVDGSSVTVVDAIYDQVVDFIGQNPVGSRPILPPAQYNVSGAWTTQLSGVVLVGSQLSDVDNGAYNADSINVSYMFGSGLSISNPMFLPYLDVNGYDATELLITKLTTGVNAQLSNTGGYINFKALDIIQQPAGLEVSWLNLESVGALDQTKPVLLQTEWSRSALPLIQGGLWYDNDNKSYWQLELDRPQGYWQVGVNKLKLAEYDLTTDLVSGKQVQLQCSVQAQVAPVNYSWYLPDGQTVNGLINTTDLTTATLDYIIPPTVTPGDQPVAFAVTDPRYPNLPVTVYGTISVQSS